MPGRVDLPDGQTLLVEADPGPAVSNGESAVVAAPEDGGPWWCAPAGRETEYAIGDAT